MEFRRILLGLGVVPAIAGAALFGACGDDDDGGGSGSSDDFVADLCGLMKQFGEDIDNVELGDIENEDDAIDAFAEPFEALADDFGDLNPPGDLEDWHEEASEKLSQVAEDLREGNFDESALDDEALPELPDDVREKYENLAEDNEDCQDADVSFTE